MSAVMVSPVGAQSLSTRVSQAPDGVVRIQLDARPGVCGDGREVIGYRSAMFARNFQSFGRWHNARCVPGPLRVTLSVDDGQVTRLRTQVGGAWPSSAGRVTDLGVVPAAEASEYFFSLVPRLETGSGKDRLLIPAVLADDVPVIQPLLELARDEERAEQTRGHAIMWLGLLGDESVVPRLVEFANDVDEDEGDRAGKNRLGTVALAALSHLDGGAGIPALIELARSGGTETRRNAVFWLGQSSDERAMRMLHRVIEDTNELNRVRSHAIFALAHGGEASSSEFAYLRALYPRLNDELKQAVLHGMQQDEGAGGRWLIERALEPGESTELRKTALFWAGQREATPTSELERVYREAREVDVREHAIFVLSQRQDEAAVDALLRIVRQDRDTDMRGKALFWLAQKNDPRVRKLIADLVLR